LFADLKEINKSAIIVPSTTSERRMYVPIGFLSNEYIATNLVHIIIDSPIYVFAIISSRMHMIWLFAVSGYLGSSIRYSSNSTYNTFPFPNISDKKKIKLEKYSLNILDQREKYSEKTLAELYDPDKMPLPLLDAHKELDLEIERCYREKPFINDQERLEHLFIMYESVKKKNEGTLI
jgi:hypothetical protein